MFVYAMFWYNVLIVHIEDDVTSYFFEFFYLYKNDQLFEGQDVISKLADQRI